MTCRSCMSLRASTGAIDMRVVLEAPAAVACVTSTPLTATLYSNALDMRVITCVRGDPLEYLNEPLGNIVLGDAILG